MLDGTVNGKPAVSARHRRTGNALGMWVPPLVNLSKMTGDGSRNVTTIPSLIITAQGGGGQDPVPRETPDMAASFIIAGTIATDFRISRPC